MSRPDDPDLISLLPALLARTRETLAGPEGAAARARLDQISAALGRLIRAAKAEAKAEAKGEARTEADAEAGEPEDTARLAADGAALRAALDQAGTAGSGRPELAALARSFDTLAAWLEHGHPGSGPDVDSLIARMEEAFGGARSPAAAAAEEERDRRLRERVQESISERLRKAGIKPGGDP